jgi:hypothetical protein
MESVDIESQGLRVCKMKDELSHLCLLWLKFALIVPMCILDRQLLLLLANSTRLPLLVTCADINLIRLGERLKPHTYSSLLGCTYMSLVGINLA